MAKTSLIVHGGAGVFRAELQESARKGCLRAAEIGQALLLDGASALDIVERVVMALENDPTFNSGTGSCANAEGEVEMDAIVIDGARGDFGAVAAIRHVKNPVRVARAVMEHTPHCMLMGRGASAFALERGFESAPAEAPPGEGGSGPDHGTVGAVALDAEGHVAAATSTGGTRDKLPGRVGDSPIIGCGAIAEDRLGGASATGDGEALMRVMMAGTVAGYLRAGRNAQEAADRALHDLKTRTGGLGGVICLDASGGIGFAHNTTHLALAYAQDDAEVVCRL